MGVRERKVEKYLHNEVKKLGGTTRKWVSPGHDGVPDRIVFLNAAIYFVEAKTVDGKLSSTQKREHVRIAEQGFQVHTVYGQEGVDSLLEEII